MVEFWNCVILELWDSGILEMCFCSFSGCLLVEMWRRFKAIDHPKCVIGLLGGLYCETPAASEGGPAEGDPAEGHPEINRTDTVKPAPHHVPLVVAWSSCSVRSRYVKGTWNRRIVEVFGSENWSLPLPDPIFMNSLTRKLNELFKDNMRRLRPRLSETQG